MKKLAFILVLSFFALFPLSSSQAQDTNDVSPSDITNIVSFVVSPETPGPNQSVQVSIEAYGLDLGASTISWSLNGSKLGSGKGMTRINFTTGAIGTTSHLSVTIDTATDSVTRTIDFSPGSVDLIWEGNVYTPPFYQGRSLWTHQSRLTLIAIPHVVNASGVEASRNSLVYTWTKDGTVLGASSGTGKNSLSVVDTVLSLPTTIQVDVSTNQNMVLGTASVTLTPGDSQILVYENNPLYGLLFGNALTGTVQLSNKEVTFSAIPFFMSPTSKSALSLAYAWSLNGAASQTGNKVTYRAPDGTSGSSHVHITVQNTNTLLQSASKDFLVQFGNNQSL